MSKKSSALAYRPCVGVMLINPQGLVWIGRRADKANDEEQSEHTEPTSHEVTDVKGVAEVPPIRAVRSASQDAWRRRRDRART